MTHDSLVIAASSRPELLALDHRPLRPVPGPARRLAFGFWFFVLAPTALAQLAPIKPPPGWQQVPSGTGACSVEKSCEELAPAMIESAQGASPLEGNLRELSRLAQQDPPITADPLSVWVVEAFRHTGMDRVRTEKLAAGVSSSAEVQAVVTEIRGRERPDEFVLLTAHLDMPNRGDGTADGQADTAVVIDAARVIRGSGSLARRSIRFVLFIGTNQENSGSQAYLTVHRAELNSAAAAVLFGVGNQPIVGFCLNGRNDILAPARELLAPARRLGAKEFTLDTSLRWGSLDFVLEGIPTLVASANPSNGPPSVRTHTSQPDAATLAELKRHVAIAALTAYALADAPQRVGPRQSRAAIEQLLQETGLAQEMKHEGLWSAWENGEHGRPRSE